MKRKITAIVTLIVMLVSMMSICAFAKRPSMNDLFSLYYDMGISHCMGSFFNKDEGVSASFAIMYFKLNSILNEYAKEIYVEEWGASDWFFILSFDEFEDIVEEHFVSHGDLKAQLTEWGEYDAQTDTVKIYAGGGLGGAIDWMMTDVAETEDKYIVRGLSVYYELNYYEDPADTAADLEGLKEGYDYIVTDEGENGAPFYYIITARPVLTLAKTENGYKIESYEDDAYHVYDGVYYDPETEFSMVGVKFTAQSGATISNITNAVADDATVKNRHWYDANTSGSLKVEIEDGYELIGVFANGVLLEGDNGIYCFDVENKGVEVVVKTALPVVDTVKEFTDVKDTWYTDAVDYAVTYGILSGVGNKEMKPDSNMTRAQFVQVLANIEGVDTTDKNVEVNFDDVKAGDWFAPAVKWASENGIVNGVTATTFKAGGNVTREQMCTMLIRFVDFAGIDLDYTVEGTDFADDDAISDWAYAAVYECQASGLVNGIDGSFKPKNLATRAQIATIMMRFNLAYEVIDNY